MSRALLVIGGLLLALSGFLVSYTTWNEWQHRQSALAEPVALPTVRPQVQVAVPTRVPTLAPTLAPAPTPTSEPPLAPTPTVEPTLAPTPEPVDTFASYGPAIRIQIPRIKVNSRIMEVGVKGGAYEAPAWEVGHHEDSANPGEPGNSIFNGHLTTINAGRVFAHLKDVQVGDTITVYTASHVLDWRVDERYDTDNDDNSFIQPTDDTRITLYTCDGQLVPLAHDYNQRLVVIGSLAAVRERPDQ